MAMKRCPICGEKYSETYQNCPFCEEEAALQGGDDIRRNVNRGKRSGKGRKFSPITLILIGLIVMMAAVLIFLLSGDDSGEKEPEDPIKTEEPINRPDGKPEDEGGSSGVMPEGPEDPEQTDKDDKDPADKKPADKDPAEKNPASKDPAAKDPAKKPPVNKPDEGANVDYQQAAKLPDGLSLNKKDFSLMNLGETYTIKASGGGSSYRWISEDEGIVSVDQTGKVTAVSGGTTSVLVTDGTKKAICIVRVRATGSLPEKPSTSQNASAYTLNREDMTIKVGEKFQLKLTGTVSSPTWSTSDSKVATVGADGTVKGVASGMATVTVSWGSGSKSCIVRVK